MDAFLPKPIRASELLTLLQSLESEPLPAAIKR
jgi:hypothetical protein